MSHTSLSVQVPSHVSSLQSALKFYLEHASSHRHPPFSSKTRSMELCRVPVSLVLQNCSQHKLKVWIVSVCVHVHIGNVRSYGEKLWGRTFLPISQFESHLQMFSPWNLGVPHSLVWLVLYSTKFYPQNAHFLLICKSFLIWKFPTGAAWRL